MKCLRVILCGTPRIFLCTSAVDRRQQHIRVNSFELTQVLGNHVRVHVRAVLSGVVTQAAVEGEVSQVKAQVSTQSFYLQAFFATHLIHNLCNQT